MKIRKYQTSGKLIKEIISPILEAAEAPVKYNGMVLDGFKLSKDMPVLSSLFRHYGNVNLNPEQQQGLLDLGNYILNKGKWNLIWNPETSRFSYDKITLPEAKETYKYLPIMTELNPLKGPGGITAPGTENYSPIIYNNGILTRETKYKNTPIKKFEGFQGDPVFSWKYAPTNSMELALIEPEVPLEFKLNEKNHKSFGHFINLGLVPEKQVVTWRDMKNQFEGKQLKNTISRNGMISTLNTFNDLIKPYEMYATGDAAGRKGSSKWLKDPHVPIGGRLMAIHDIGETDPGVYLKILDQIPKNIPFDRFTWDNPGLSTDSYNLVGKVGEKSGNSLRWGGWNSSFMDLGVTNKNLIEAQKAHKANKISVKEYEDIIKNYLYENFPSISNWNPEDLVKIDRGIDGTWEVFFRHPFTIKTPESLRNGGILKRK